MSDYIERQKAIEACENTPANSIDAEKGLLILNGLGRACDVIKAIPYADVVPVVHSRWIKTADGAECENCGREAVYQTVDDHWEYEPWCPHCGARMDKE